MKMVAWAMVSTAPRINWMRTDSAASLNSPWPSTLSQSPMTTPRMLRLTSRTAGTSLRPRKFYSFHHTTRRTKQISSRRALRSRRITRISRRRLFQTPCCSSRLIKRRRVIQLTMKSPQSAEIFSLTMSSNLRLLWARMIDLHPKFGHKKLTLIQEVA